MSATNFYLGITSCTHLTNCTHTPSIPENKSLWKGLPTLAILIGGVLITKKLTSRLGKASSALGTLGLIAVIWRKHFPSSAVNLTQAFSEIEQEAQDNPQKVPFAFHKLLRILYGREMNGPDLDQAKGCLSKVFDLLEPSIKEDIYRTSSIDRYNLTTRLCLEGIIPSFDGCTYVDTAVKTALKLSKNEQKETIGKILDFLEQNDIEELVALVPFEETKRYLVSPNYDNHKKLFQLFMFITLSKEGIKSTSESEPCNNQLLYEERMESLTTIVTTAFPEEFTEDLINCNFNVALNKISEILTSVQVIDLFKEAQVQKRYLHCSIIYKLIDYGKHKKETLQPLIELEKSILQSELQTVDPYFKSNPLGQTAKDVISKASELISSNHGKSLKKMVGNHIKFQRTGAQIDSSDSSSSEGLVSAEESD